MSSAPHLPPHPLTTVGALAVSPAGRVLLIRTHKWRDTWGVPGGKVERGESLHRALLREFREETGLELSDVRWAPTQEAIDSPEFHRPAHFVLLNFVARCDHERVRLNDEAQEYAWLAPDALHGVELNSFTRRLVEYYRAEGFGGAPLEDPLAAGGGAAERAEESGA